jgi:hypothetical protein
MDDVNVNPYRAIEYAQAPLSKTVQEETLVNSDPKWLVPGGLTVMGGTNQLVNLMGEDSLRFQIAGDTDNHIRSNFFVRIYLWPLTTWNTASSCTLVCKMSEMIRN